MRVSDTSIYESVKTDVFELLERYPKEELRVRSNKKDSSDNFIYDDIVLYVVDSAAIEKLREYDKLLKMEYSQYDEVNSLKDDSKKKKKKRGKSAVETFSLASIIKVINFDEPCNTYKTFIAESWAQINKRDKVKESLDVEFSKYRNALRANTKRRLKEKKVSPEIEHEILQNVEADIAEAEKERDYIKEHFDELDVCISAYFERAEYAGVHWFIKKKRQQDVNLRKKVPNVLWREDLSEDELVRDDNKLIHFLNEAKRAYGHVFYKPKKDSEL